MAKLSKKKAKKAPMTREAKAMSRKIRKLQRQVIPKGVQFVLKQSNWPASIDYQVRSGTLREALLGTIILVDKAPSIAWVTEHILGSDPPQALGFLQCTFELWLDTLRDWPSPPSELPDDPVEQLTYLLHVYERATRPDEEPPPSPPPPGPLANSAHAA